MLKPVLTVTATAVFVVVATAQQPTPALAVPGKGAPKQELIVKPVQGRQALRTTHPHALLTLAPSASPQEVSFDTADGGHIVADLYGSGPDGVVLAHGAAFNKESWAQLATVLAAEGHLVLAIDFRGYGMSKPGTEKDALYQDVLAAIWDLRARGARTVSVVGASMGGGASGRAATESRAGDIDRLFLLSPVPIPNPDAIKAGRLMYVASRDERLAPAVKAQFERAPEPKRLELLDGDAHAQNIFPTAQGPKLTRLIVDFLANH